MSAPTGNVRQKDLEILAAAWKTSKVTPEVDFKALADLGFYKNANSARASFGALKTRLFGAEDALAAADGTPKKSVSATPRKRKSKGATEKSDAGDGGDEDVKEEGESPKKKGKKAVKKETVKIEQGEEIQNYGDN